MPVTYVIIALYLSQEDDFDDEWQIGPGTGNNPGSGAALAAGGSSMQAPGQQAAADAAEEEDEEWEEV